MLNAKKRRIAELEAHVAVLRDKLDHARETPDSHASRADRFAGDRIKAATADAREMAYLNDVAEGWETLASQHQRRADRLARAVVRCWAEIGRLRRQLAALDVTVLTRQLRDANERIAKQEERLLMLQTANEEADWRFAARAGAVRLQKDDLKAAS